MTTINTINDKITNVALELAIKTKPLGKNPSGEAFALPEKITANYFDYTSLDGMQTVVAKLKSMAASLQQTVWEWENKVESRQKEIEAENEKMRLENENLVKWCDSYGYVFGGKNNGVMTCYFPLENVERVRELLAQKKQFTIDVERGMYKVLVMLGENGLPLA